MKSKSSDIIVLTISLFALAITSIECSVSDSESSGLPLIGRGNFAEAGLGGMFKSMTDSGGAALTDFMSSFTSPKMITGTSGGAGGSGGDSGEKRDGSKKESGGFLGMKDPMDFFKLMLNPMEFMNRIAKEFKLDRGQFTQAVGRGMNFGLETALQPPVVCIKIIEKVFVPDSCKLKFVCEVGRQLAMFKGQLPKFPDSYFDGASTAKAFYDGATGRECDQVYSCGGDEGPKLKKEFAGLKQKFSTNDQSSDSSEYAASQQSRVTASRP